MAKKVFTDESLKTFVDEIKTYVTDVASTKADTSHTHSISNITNLQTSLDAKQATVTGGASTITSSNLTASRALISNSSGKVAVSAVTSTELGYLDGVTSNVQTQLDAKAASSHNHAASNITSGTLSSDRLPTVPITKGGTGATTAAAALTNFGLTATASELNIMDGVTATTTELNYMDGVTSNVQTQLDAKQATITGGATTITSSNLTASRALISNSSGKVAVSAVTSTELGYLDGVTSNVQTQLDGKSSTSHTHSYAGSSSVGGSATSAVKLDTSTAGDANTPVYFTGGKPVACTSLDLNTTGSSATCTGNSATATKLQTARTIGLGTGATGTATSFNGSANITIPVTDVKESYLSWGGKSLSGSVSPVGAALSTEHSANRLAYLNPDAVTVEYSNDAGSTWTDSGLADSAKINFVTKSNGISIGSNSTVTTSHQTRITLTAQNGTTGYVYTRPRKMLINVSTAGHGISVTIEAKTGASSASWTTLGTYTLTGWSGWNDIPMSISTFGGGTTQTSNYWYMRLTFSTTSVSSSYPTTKSTILGLRLFGDTCWTRTSNMGETGHLYSYDYSQNATFPANVTATTFVGALSGNATTATSATTATTATKLGSSTVGGTAKPVYLSSGTATACSSTVGSATQPVYMNAGTITACTYTLGKSVPSNAVFTDTNTKVTNTLATTTKAYVTGTTSASTNTGTQVFDTGVYLDTTAGQLTATTFNGTTFSGSGVATLAEVEDYLGI